MWRRGVAVECRTYDQEVAGSSLGRAPRRKNSGQVSHKCVSVTKQYNLVPVRKRLPCDWGVQTLCVALLQHLLKAEVTKYVQHYILVLELLLVMWTSSTSSCLGWRRCTETHFSVFSLASQPLSQTASASGSFKNVSVSEGKG